MHSIEVSDKEFEVIIMALRGREDRMFRDGEIYKSQGNKIAQFDCIHEMHTAQHLRERLEKEKAL